MATAESNVEFITAGAHQFLLIGTGVGKSDAKGPSAQGGDSNKRHPLPRSLLRIRWQASMIIFTRAVTSLGAECHCPQPPGGERLRDQVNPKAGARFPHPSGIISVGRPLPRAIFATFLHFFRSVRSIAGLDAS